MLLGEVFETRHETKKREREVTRKPENGGGVYGYERDLPPLPSVGMWKGEKKNRTPS